MESWVPLDLSKGWLQHRTTTCFANRYGFAGVRQNNERGAHQLFDGLLEITLAARWLIDLSYRHQNGEDFNDGLTKWTAIKARAA